MYKTVLSMSTQGHALTPFTESDTNLNRTTCRAELLHKFLHVFKVWLFYIYLKDVIYMRANFSPSIHLFCPGSSQVYSKQ